MINIILKRVEDADEFKNLLEQHNYTFKQFKSVKIIFTIYTTKSEFILSDHPFIKEIVEGLGSEGTPAYSPINQTMNINCTTSLIDGVWSIPRIIRRKAPWNLEYSPTTINTFAKYNRSGEGVDVYVVDSGIDLDHPEFEGRAFDVRGTGSYGNYHGTACASCAVSKTFGIAKKANVYGVMGYSGTATNDAPIAEAIDDCITHYLSRAGTNRPAVMSLSFGGPDGFPLTEAAFDTAVSVGITVCIAAGNNRADLDVVNMYPAINNVAETITVGGSAINDTPFYGPSYFGTNFGSPVDIYAPSQWIKMAIPVDQGTTIIFNGTSFGTPYVAGVIACMLEGYQRPTTRAQVAAIKQRLLDNATAGGLIIPDNFRSGVGGIPTQSPTGSMYLEPSENKLLYLDPYKIIEGIPELTPL